MESIPPLLSSAERLLSQGFSRMNQGAAAVAAGTDSSGVSANGALSTVDPLQNGFNDLLQGKNDVRAGVVLMRTYERTTDDLIQMSEPWPRHRYVDRYA